jgi:hypothetical protein
MRSFTSWRSQVFSLKTSTITSSARQWCYLPGIWLPEMVRLRGAGPDSLYQQRPADFLAVPRLRRPRSQLVSRRFRMAVRRPPLPGILEQATRNLGRYWVDRHVCRDGYHHSVHAEWLGPSCWISRDGRQRSLSNERCRPFGSVDLLVETGCPACPRSRR